MLVVETLDPFTKTVPLCLSGKGCGAGTGSGGGFGAGNTCASGGGAVTDTKEFKNWFKKSRVVGKDGKPLIVYHGSPDVRPILSGKGFDSFLRGENYFFTDDYGVADTYADDRRSMDFQNAEPHTIPTYLSLQNPMLVDARGQVWRKTEAHIKEARDKGHDGIIIRNTYDEYNSTPKNKGKKSTVYVVFSNKQIKSAMTKPLKSRVDGKELGGGANSGGFNPESDNIFLGCGAGSGSGGGFGKGNTCASDNNLKKWFGKSKVKNAEGKPMVVYHGSSKEIFIFDKNRSGNVQSKMVGVPIQFFTNSTELANAYAGDVEGSQVLPVHLKIEQPLVIEANGRNWTETLNDISENLEVYRSEEERLLREFDFHLNTKYDFERANEFGIDVEVSKEDARIRAKLFSGFETKITRSNNGYWNRKVLGVVGYDGIVVKNVMDFPSKLHPTTESYNPFNDVYMTFEPNQIKSAIGNKGTFDPNNNDIRFGCGAGTGSGGGFGKGNTCASGGKENIDPRLISISSMEKQLEALTIKKFEIEGKFDSSNSLEQDKKLNKEYNDISASRSKLMNKIYDLEQEFKGERQALIAKEWGVLKELKKEGNKFYEKWNKVDDPFDNPEYIEGRKKIKSDIAGWKDKIEHGITKGELTQEDAESIGYYRTDGKKYQELPKDLWHVTTASDLVLKHGLKTRDELGQQQGKGLGGGTDNTISLTYDQKAAHALYLGVTEAHDFAKGKITPVDILRDAHERGFVKEVLEQSSSSFSKKTFTIDMLDKNQHELPKGVEQVIRGVKIEEKYGSEPPKKVEGSPWKSVGKLVAEDGVEYGNKWERKTEESELLWDRFQLYKSYSFWRQQKTGRLDPLFFSTDVEGFRDIDKSQIKILKVQAKDKSRGISQPAELEWRVNTGSVLEVQGVEQFDPEKYEVKFSLGCGAGSGDGGGFGKGNTCASGGKQTDSENFKRWFGNSVIVDEDGNPIILYHGTTNNFTKFDVENASIESDFGAGIYATNNVEDAGFNYGNVNSPDLKNKIERLAEQKMYDDDELEFDDAKKLAISELTDHGGAILPIYVKMENPVVVGGREDTYFDLEIGFDEEGEFTGEESGKFLEFAEKLHENAEDNFYGADTRAFIGELDDVFDGGISAKRLFREFKKSEHIIYTEGENGRLASSELLRQTLQDIGFDGIIDTTVNDKFGSGSVFTPMDGLVSGTKHYIAFDKNQIKSAIGNNGDFDPNNDDITYSDLQLSVEKDPLVFWKQVIYVGNFHKKNKTEDMKFSVDEKLIDHWVKTHKEFLVKGISVPLPKDHSFDPEDNRGEVLELKKGIDTKNRIAMFAKVKFRDTEAAKMAKTTKVSLYSPNDWVDETGKTHARPFRHLALTDYPVINNLDGFIAASHIKKDKKKMALSTLAKSLGIECDNCDDEAISASIALAFEDLKKEREKTKGEAGTTTTPPPVAASMVNLLAENRETKLNMLVQNANITSKVFDDLKKRFCENNTLTLSLQSDDYDDGFDSLVKTLGNNEPIELIERSGSQTNRATLQLNAKDNVLIAGAEKMAEDAK